MMKMQQVCAHCCLPFFVPSSDVQIDESLSSPDFAFQDQQKGEIIQQITISLSSVDDAENNEQSSGYSTNSTALANAVYSVSDVFGSIYKLSYLNSLTELNDDPQEDKEKENGIEGENEGICSSCAHILGLLFQLYEQFNQLRHHDSYYSKKIVKLDEIIKQLNASSRQQSVSQLISVEKAENITILVDPLGSGEEGLQNDYYNDDSTHFPDENSPVESGPPDDDHILPSSSSSNINVSKTKRSTKQEVRPRKSTRVVSTPSPRTGPWVKLRRMSPQEIAKKTSPPSLLRRPRRRPPPPSAANAAEDTVQDELPKKRIKKLKASSLVKPREKSKKSTFVCKVCNKVYTSSAGLKFHEYSHAQDGDDLPYRCSVCQKGFAHRGNMKRHLTVHGVVEKANVCNFPNCDKSYFSMWQLQRHVNACHFNSNPPQQLNESSDPNGQPIENASNNENNDGEMETGQQKPYLCSHCPKLFKYEKNLNDHVQSCHTDDPMYKCSICEKVLVSKGGLKQHQIAFHPDEKGNFNRKLCPHCGHTFTSNTLLKLHVASRHTNERPFKCPHANCNKAFVRHPKLKDHLVSTHGAEKKFECSVCQKPFSLQVLLRQHERIHDPDRTRNHHCNQCDKSFFTSQKLQRHLKIHGGDDHQLISNM